MKKDRHPYPPAKKYPTVPPLVTVGELADLFGVNPQWPYQMRTNGVLPEPDGYLGKNPYWIKARISDWWETNPNRRRS